MQTSPTEAVENTDRELWREREGDYYANSIHVTEDGGIGINCGGSVIVKPLREWHALASSQAASDDVVERARTAALLALQNGGVQGKDETFTDYVLRVASLAAAIPPAGGVLPEYGEWLPDIWDAYLRELIGHDHHSSPRLPATFRWHEFWDRIRTALNSTSPKGGEA